jgi:hypothetical protein
VASGPGTWLGADNIQQPVGQQPQRPRRSMRGEHGAEEISAVGRWEMALTAWARYVSEDGASGARRLVGRRGRLTTRVHLMVTRGDEPASARLSV